MGQRSGKHMSSAALLRPPLQICINVGHHTGIMLSAVSFDVDIPSFGRQERRRTVKYACVLQASNVHMWVRLDEADMLNSGEGPTLPMRYWVINTMTSRLASIYYHGNNDDEALKVPFDEISLSHHVMITACYYQPWHDAGPLSCEHEIVPREAK